MTSPTTTATGSVTTTTFTPITAPSGTGFVTIPGGAPGVSSIPAGQPAIPGPQNDGSDFYGLAAALVVIVGAILLVRRLVPLQRGSTLPTQRRRPPAGLGEPADSPSTTPASTTPDLTTPDPPPPPPVAGLVRRPEP